MRPLEPVLTAHLYAGLHAELLQLLESLSPEDWLKPTVCATWLVRDIAAHILDTQLRILSIGRDGYQPPPPTNPISTYPDLVSYLNLLNQQWVNVSARLSPAVLLDLLRTSGPHLSAHVLSLDPDADAIFPVAWAGETHSKNWFDIGRNYTEYWHHQQQIRDAVGAPPLTARTWLHPVLSLFVRAIPRAYASASAIHGAHLLIRITGPAGDEWTHKIGSTLSLGPVPNPDTIIELTGDSAWRLFTKGLSPSQKREQVHVYGNASLAEPFLEALAVMA